MGIHISRPRLEQSSRNEGLAKEVNKSRGWKANPERTQRPSQSKPASFRVEQSDSEKDQNEKQGDEKEAVLARPQEMLHHGSENHRKSNGITDSARISSQSGTHHGSSFTETIVNDVAMRVSQIWSKIDDGVSKWLKINKARPASATKGWKVVRLFVSSTFTDFYSEREVLVKRVVPHLNQWCLERKIQLIECDLRWGIPKDSTANDTIDICLSEIEKCLEETGGQAFFLNLLGERYGWVPNIQEINQDTVSKFGLIDGISMTHTEVLHAALRSNSQNALFLFRDASILQQLPEEVGPLFAEPTEFGQDSLAELKSQLRDRFPKQVLEYSCSFGSVETSPENTKVFLTDLDDFEEKVADFFKVAIERMYPQVDEDLTKDEWNFVFQDAFIEKKGALLVGREAEREQIVDFVSGGNNYGDLAQNYLLVTGSSGIGKSSLLASVVRQLKATSTNCIYNFASASPGSTLSASVREIFTRELMKWLGLDHTDFHDMTYEDKIAKYHEMIQLFGKEQKQMVIIFDAVNQFSNSQASLLNWLPSDLHSSVKCIISCTNDCQLLELIERKLKQGSLIKMHLSGFASADTKEYIQSIFARYNKRLDEEQMEVFASRHEACNPLWLSLACEELRIFGEFERLSIKIRDLPDSLQELVFAVLKRLISEDETGILKAAVCLLGCSTSGLTETELRWSCGNGEDQLPLLAWKRCRLLLQPYLLMVSKRRGEENLAFFHDSVNIVIRTRLLGEISEKRSYHSRLANVFKHHCDDDMRVAEELPSQLEQANEFRELVEFYSKDKRSIRSSSVDRSFKLQKIRCQTRILVTQDMFCSPVYICNMCSHRVRAFTPLPDLNKDVCVICGNRVAFKKDTAMAYVCLKHKDATSPGTSKCYSCKSVIFLQQRTTGISFSQMYLCLYCSSSGRRCIKLQY